MVPGPICYVGNRNIAVDEILGAALDDKQRAMLRAGDRRVWRNVTGMIVEVVDPLRSTIERGNQLGLEVYTRREMKTMSMVPSRMTTGCGWVWLAISISAILIIASPVM